MGFEPTTYSSRVEVADKHSMTVQVPTRLSEQIKWDDFETYLRQQIRPNNIGHLINLGKEYGEILRTRDARPLLTISQGRRKHAMDVLAHLSRYLGVYKQWKEIIENFGLKWKVKQPFNPLQKTNITEMLQYLKEVKSIAPNDIWNTFLFDVMTGLRASESLAAIKLIQQGVGDYYNEELQILQHFKFPQIFSRRSKNAHISIMSPEVLEIAKSACPQYYRIRMFLRKHNKPCNLKYARKIFATYLHDNGISREQIDLLQGRTGTSIFENHYYSPNIKELISKVKPLLERLESTLHAL